MRPAVFAQRKNIALVATLAALLAHATRAQAVYPPIIERVVKAATVYGPFRGPTGVEPYNPLEKAATIIGLILGTLLAFLGVLFLFLMIAAGVRWMTARGNEQEVEKAKTTIQQAAIGLLIVVAAYALVSAASLIITQTGLLRAP